MQIKAAKGTRDILPAEAEAFRSVEGAARSLFALYGFREIRTPIFEPTELFHKSTGADTDIVGKEMYTFADRAGRSLTLRPEGTPGVVRAALEHGLLRAGDSDRLYYIGAMFRYEKPQKGRFRQFSQIGVEAFGSSHPATDAEVMEMSLALFGRLGIEDGTLQINSVGHPAENECRGAYRRALREAAEPLRDELCEDCRRRLDANPLRILDCKKPDGARVRDLAPAIQDYLCAPCAKHMAGVRDCLGALGIRYEVNPRLVRGLDYYTRTTFEVASSELGAQNALCGGGRYDLLVESMGGPATSAFGFAIGTDRLVMVAQEMARRAGRGELGHIGGPDLYIVHLGDAALQEGLAAARALRERGLAVRLDPDARDIKKQMSRASTLGARYALLLGERELERGAYGLKRLSDAVQREVPARAWDQIRAEIVDDDRRARIA